MKLRWRLALPLLVTAVLTSAILTAGMAVLVRGTGDAMLDQAGRQLSRIAEHALRERAQGLHETASVFAALRGSMAARDAQWRHPPLDALALVAVPGGRSLSAAGSAIDPEDLRGLREAPPGEPAVLRAAGGPVVCGTALEEGGRALVVIGTRMGPAFAAELKRLLQSEVEVRADGAAVAATAEDPGSDTHPVRRAFRTPGGAEVVVIMHLPAEGLRRARRRALSLALGGGAVLLGVTLAVYGYAVARVTRPIRDLIAATGRVAAGEAATAPEAGAPDELGTLVREFNRMASTLKETRERLVHSAKLSSVGQLVAGISHELNNPLMGLLGHAEHLAGRLPASDPAREKLEVILREGRRMQRTLAGLRDFTRPGGTAREPVDLNHVAGEVLALVRHDAEKAGIACAARLSAAPVVVRAAPDRVRQVALNVVLNALQASAPGSTLEVATAVARADGGEAGVLEVADTGSGMTPEVLARVREPFFSTKPGRMGLGLAICHEIVAEHGGTLDIESTPGQGTRVRVAIPLEARS